VLARQGFKRLVILDFANYNWIVKQRVRELNLDSGVIQAVWVNPKQFAKDAADKAMLPDNGGGAVEVSLAMALEPGIVKRPLVDFDPSVPREYVDYRGLKTVSNQGHWGKPSKATPEAGAGFYKAMIEKTRAYVDWALELFPGGKPIGTHEGEEIWWPEGTTPGLEGAGVDWRSSLLEIAHNPTDMAVLPTGAIEQHSPSMPLATDHLQAVEISRRVAAELKAYLLPAMPIVTSWCHIGFRGTLTFGAMTARAVIEDIAASVQESGFRKLAIVNVHGGNWVIKPTIVDFCRAHPTFQLIATGDIFAYRGQAPVEHLHADAGEGSFVKAFYPKAFKAERAVDYSPFCTASVFDLVGMAGVSPQGSWGYASKATAEKGRENVEAHASEAAAYIKRTFSDLQGRYPSRTK
jgi:creatinine amidohydrolase/Fe(II)-dependent formamide hydrolase-like protein